MERDVTELSLDGTEPMYVGTSTPGPDQPDAFLQWQARHDLSSSSKKEKDEHIPISQRKWEHISSVDKLLASRFPISIGMTHLLRPRRDLRDQDGAVSWEFFSSKFEGFRSKVAAWTIKDWKNWSAEWNGRHSVRVLSGSTWSNQTCDVNPRSFRRSQNRSEIAKQRANSLRMDRFYISRWIRMGFQFHIRRGTHCWKNCDSVRKTNMHLHSSKSCKTFEPFNAFSSQWRRKTSYAS